MARQFLEAVKTLSLKKAAKEMRAVTEQRARKAIRVRRIAMKAAKKILFG